MAAMPGRWFGFGFNQFGQVVNRRECEGDGKVLEPVTVTVHSLGKAGQWPAGGSCLRKLSPAWSHTACLGDDGSIYVFGFVDGRPWQQMCIVNQAHRGCMDILSSEKYLLMLWQDRVECRDIQNLSTGEVEGDLIWVKQLKDREKQCTALPLIPDGYVTTTLPFYKPLAPQLRARKLALGSEHAVLLSSDFTVYSWGSGRHGQLGHGGVEDEAEPRIVEALHGLAMAEIAAGGWHSHQEIFMFGDGMSLDSWDYLPSHAQRRSIGRPLSKRDSRERGKVNSSLGVGVTTGNLATDSLIVLIFQDLLSTLYETVFLFSMLFVEHGTLLCLHNRKHFEPWMNCVLSLTEICLIKIMSKISTVAS
ncbi:RCC1 domain-containing protein 1 isoform X3 [Rhincodon typus]|uniref:RCC1 domain-containing protein 1 isoform X3 n=1 Tax=Rhincodon typus TaxID=259920 RepID=UPI00202FB5D6|nr:RCC1 domain-containing protein 1 isoform X3 [Rhincodon typus]